MSSGKRKYSGPSRRDNYTKPRRASYKPSSATVSRRSTGYVSRPRAKFGEIKGVDTILTLSPVINTTNTNASSFVLNLVPPGSASYNRIGRKIYNKSVRMRGVVKMQYALETTTSDITGNLLRMVLVWDKQPSSGAIPAFDTIFGVTDQAGTESSTYLAPLRYDNMDRFKILKDCMIRNDVAATPPLAGTTNLVEAYYPFDEYVKLGNRETVFSGQTSPATIADISTGALYLFFRSLNNTGASSLIGVDASSIARLRFTD